MQNRDSNIVETAVHLSIIEVGLGSLLHSLHIPFTGHILSLNQGLFLEHSVPSSHSRGQAFESIMNTSLCVAIIKSLSPAGKKLGPMISISTQGFLLGLGHLLLGNNILGKMLGMALLSFWAFVQPFVTYLLMYGPELFKAIDYMISKIEEGLGVTNTQVYIVLLIGVILKLAIAISLPLFSEKIVLRIQSKITHQRTHFSQKKKSFWRKHAFIFFSFLLMGSFYLLHGKDMAETMWIMLRPISIVILISYVSNAKWVEKYLFSKLEHLPFYQNLKSTLNQVRKNLSDK